MSIRKKIEQNLNRGRFQAQGGGVEESRAWSRESVPTKDEGKDWIDELKQKLSPKEQKERRVCFEKAVKWVDAAPIDGYDAMIITSFLPSPPKKDVRVDGEIRKGKAFKNKVVMI